MYALIYDEFDPAKPEKEVISVHSSREKAEEALAKRMKKLERRVWECYARIVWVRGRVRAGDRIRPGSFDTWAPDEKIPEGESSQLE